MAIGNWKLLAEKFPLFALAAASAGFTLLAQKSAIVVQLPLTARLGNALVTYATYIGRILRPVNLAAVYPPAATAPPVWQAAGAAALLLLITAGVLWRARRQPCLFTGWFWFAGTLVPVIGILQVGAQTSADRFTYLPIIGILMMTAWGAPELLSRWRHGKPVLAAAALAVLAACTWGSSRQIPLWKDSYTLFDHALKTAGSSPVAHSNLGDVLIDLGRPEEALRHCQASLRLQPDFFTTHNTMGVAFADLGRTDEAIACYRESIRLAPDYMEAHNNLGNALKKQNRLDEAIEQFREALRLNPVSAEVYSNLGNTLSEQNRLDEAIEQFREALRLNPGSAEIYNNMGFALGKQNRYAEAVQNLREAERLKPGNAVIRRNLERVLAARSRQEEIVAQQRELLERRPDNPAVLNNLAWLLATSADAALRNGAEAVDLAERAVQLAGGNNPSFLDTLAAAYAEAGRFDEAVATAERAAELARAKPDETQAQKLESRLELYRKKLPFRQ